MTCSAEASAEINTAANTSPPLPHRQEVFARHIVAGCSQAEAARRAGYAWDSARQTGSRLVADINVAARIAELALAKEDGHRQEHDDLVGNLKRLMTDSMSKKNVSGALRAIDMIARFQGHYANGNRGQSGLTPALADGRDSFDAPHPAPPPPPPPPPESRPYPRPRSRFRPADAARTAAAARGRPSVPSPAAYAA